ncbi:MAG: hypothetical protein ACI854_002227 [Arenicella sp.]|jgi:uncharacterized protein (DUF2132 family)
MSEQDRNNPLHGVGLDTMFSEILRHYHWEILSEQLKFKCLESHPSFSAATKFLKKTKWAREKTEAFYLYKFKRLPIPSDEEHLLPPRERSFDGDLEAKEPAAIKAGDKQFFDDPISGPKFHDKPAHEGGPQDKKPYDKPSRTRAPSKQAPRRTEIRVDESAVSTNADDSAQSSTTQSVADRGSESAKSSDPWGKWKS